MLRSLCPGDDDELLELLSLLLLLEEEEDLLLQDNNTSQRYNIKWNHFTLNYGPRTFVLTEVKMI